MIALVLAAVLAADHRYIIPLIGSAQGPSASHYARGMMLNPTARTATVRRVGLFPSACAMTETWQIPPHGRLEVGFPITSNCSGVAAVEVVSDEPLHVTGSVLTFLDWPSAVMDRQEFEVPTDWIDAGQEAVTSGVAMEIAPYRMNLLVINPNPEPLVVEATVDRSEYDATRVDTFEVPPATVRLFAIEPVANPREPSPFPHVISGEHDITVRANRRFWAGASSVDLWGGNVFRKAIPLEP